MTSLEIVSLAGLLSGALDITATSTLLKTQGIPLKRLLQTIASGALGPSSFQQGKKTAALGLFFHFVIAFSAALIYYAISRKMSALIDYPLFSGVVYGSAVHLVMSRIVVPLSAVQKRVFSPKAFLTQLIIHIFCVGLPIALIVSQFSQ
jgi:uncharacterized membrane protein YagU involved in acid resistance